MRSKLIKILLGLLAAIFVLMLSALIWYLQAIRPANKDADNSITYTLAQGTSVTELADQLEQQDIIRSSTAFIWYVTLKGSRGRLLAGTYELDPSNNTPEIADTLAQGHIAHNKIVVPEGSTVAKIATLATEQGISEDSFKEALKEQYNFDFLAARPSGYTSLEGYLFPDSYEVAKPPRPKVVIQDMLTNFATKVSKTDIPQRYNAEGMTLHQGLTLASVVEREAGKAQDRPIIAQVFLKRLKMGMPLESDVTVIYGAEQLGTGFDVNLNSPYNTYNHRGLPPGPICNPGLDSMRAVAHPATTDYLYFLADKQGNVHYAKTAEEHVANVKKYLQ